MDNTFVIDNLLRQNESDVLEFKEKYFPEVIAKNVTAMLNNRGGDILVGITDDKRVIGIDKGIQIEKLLSRLLSGITPSAPIDVQLVAIRERYIKRLVIAVKAYQRFFPTEKMLISIGKGCLYSEPTSRIWIWKRSKRQSINCRSQGNQ